MADEQAIYAAIKAEVAQTTISADEFLRRVDDVEAYDYSRSHWRKVMKLAEQLKPAPVPPPVPAPSPLQSGNRCVYFSNVTDEACAQFAACGPGYTALVTADPHPAYAVTDAQLAKLRSGGGVVASWCDCDATPYAAAVKMAHDRGLAFAGGQAEDSAQYWNAVNGGAKHIIGNPANLLGGALTDAREKSTAGILAFIGEVLHPDPGYSAQGVNISSAAMYVDMDVAHGGYQPLATFAVMPQSLKAGASIYAGSRMSGADWDLYRAWTRP